MEILTYPVGLVIGLLPVVANVGPAAKPAQILLDGRSACTVTATAPQCTVDLGPNLRVHLLEIVRSDAEGHVLERARRWINKPGAQAEIYLSGKYDAAGKQWQLSLGWGHPAKLEPRSLAVTVDGRPAFDLVKREFAVSANDPNVAHVVTVDVIFPDGRRGSQTRRFGGGYSDTSEATMQAVPIIPVGSRQALPNVGTLDGVPVRSVEDAPAEVAFVLAPAVLATLARRIEDLSSDQLAGSTSWNGIR